MIGSTLNKRYEVRSLLGEGGMAAVYLAFDMATKTEVALKTIHPHLELTEKRRARLAGEFCILSMLSHHAIVRGLDLYADNDEAPFFTMELVAGLPLEQRLNKLQLQGSLHEPSVVSELLRLLCELAEALNYIHSKGIIYCDLKPSNVLLVGRTEEITEAHIKLIDFGISRIEEKQELEAVGTSLYNSPEQIRNERLDCRSDIYSFGISAFELITGALPFKSENHYSAAQSHFFEQVPSAVVQNRAVSPTLDRMLRVCMKKEPSERYQSMKEVVQRLTVEMHMKQRPPLLKRITAPILNFLKSYS